VEALFRATIDVIVRKDFSDPDAKERRPEVIFWRDFGAYDYLAFDFADDGAYEALGVSVSI
jgi:hypothetical protein